MAAKKAKDEEVKKPKKAPASKAKETKAKAPAKEKAPAKAKKEKAEVPAGPKKFSARSVMLDDLGLEAALSSYTKRFSSQFGIEVPSVFRLPRGDGFYATSFSYCY
mgnify:FL=1